MNTNTSIAARQAESAGGSEGGATAAAGAGRRQRREVPVIRGHCPAPCCTNPSEGG